MTYTISISLYYNYKGGTGVTGPETHDLAIPDAPELGYEPHAQEVMKHYGINYQDAHPQPVSDSWVFYGCDKTPEVVPKWMGVRDEG